MATPEDLEQRIANLEKRISYCESIILSMHRYFQNSLPVEIQTAVNKVLKPVIEEIEQYGEDAKELSETLREKVKSIQERQEKKSKEVIPDFPWKVKKDPDKS